MCSCEDVTGAAAVSIPLKAPSLLFQAHNCFQHSASVSKVELFHLVFIFWWPVTVNVAYCSRVCVCVCVHAGCACGAGARTETQKSAICSHIINLIVIPKSTVASPSRGPTTLSHSSVTRAHVCMCVCVCSGAPSLGPEHFKDKVRTCCDTRTLCVCVC